MLFTRVETANNKVNSKYGDAENTDDDNITKLPSECLINQSCAKLKSV